MSILLKLFFVVVFSLLLIIFLSGSINSKSYVNFNNEIEESGMHVRGYTNNKVIGVVSNILANEENKKSKNQIPQQNQIPQSNQIQQPNFFQPPNQNQQIIQGYKPTILILYSECGNSHFQPFILDPQINFMPIYCDNNSKDIDGNEAGTYLNFIINNYDKPLADVYFFMHGHNNAWHYFNPLKSTLQQLITSNYFKNELFGGYQCYWNFGPTLKKDNVHFLDLMKSIFNGTSISPIPADVFSYPCCGTFWVKTNEIQKRPKEEYIRLLKNTQEWNINNRNNRLFQPNVNAYSGRIFEMMWNVILANVSIVRVPPYCGVNLRKNPIGNIPLP